MKSVKKEMILVIGLLSVFATASLISLCTSCNKEPEIEYRDKVVEVEKPVEVIKEVEVVKEVEVEKKVPVEVIREVKIGVPFEVEKIVEKEVYVEKSQVDLNGIEVVKLDDNLYEFEFNATQCSKDASSIKKLFELKGISYYYYNYSSDFCVFKEGELVSKPGYVIKDIILANPRWMTTPYILDNDYNQISPSSINKNDYTGAAIKYEYANINKEQVQISWRSGSYYGAEVVRVTFSIR